MPEDEENNVFFETWVKRITWLPGRSHTNIYVCVVDKKINLYIKYMMFYIMNLFDSEFMVNPIFNFLKDDVSMRVYFLS